MATRPIGARANIAPPERTRRNGNDPVLASPTIVSLRPVEGARWLVEPGRPIDLTGEPTRSTDGAPGDKAKTLEASAGLRRELAALQERLWAESRQSCLVVLQAMHAGGKDGAIKKVFGGANPQSCRVTSFKEPSAEELKHDFLWRIYKALPAHGEIGVFNRSHYEDVVATRVKDLVPEETIAERIEIINSFEHALRLSGTRVVKVFLNVSKDEQARRLRARLDGPHKRWKYRPGDLIDRKLWPEFMAAYGEAISATSTHEAPWHVIPADRKWYRDWALLSILVETLSGMEPAYPDLVPSLSNIVID